MLDFLKRILNRLRQRKGNIEFTSDGFRISGFGETKEVLWGAVTKIEVFRIPSLIVEDFCVVLFQSNVEPVVIDDHYPDFLKFQNTVWQRWPQIKDRWIAIYCGSPLTRERAVLWESQTA